MAARPRGCQAKPASLTLLTHALFSSTMPLVSPAFRLIAAALVGIWIAATLVALFGAWRRGSAPAPADAPAVPTLAPPQDGLLLADFSPDMINLSSLPIWWVDRDLKLAGANDAYARAVGYPTAAGAVRANAELAPGTRRFAAQARESDRAVVGEERVVVAGDHRLLEIIAIPLRGGEVAHLALDETRRHAAYTAANGRARALVDTLDRLATAVAWFDATGALEHFNRCFVDLFAQDSAFLDARPDFDRVLDSMRAAGRLPETRDFPNWRARLRAWFDAPGRQTVEEWSLPGGMLLTVHIQPRDGGLLLLFEDRTEQAALAAARDSLLRVYGTMLDSLREGIAVFGPDGRLKFFNRRLAEIIVAPADLLAVDLPAERVIEHLGNFVGEPARADDLRAMIVGATAGRVGRGGNVISTLGYLVEFAAVPLPGGNALITCSATKVATTPAPTA